MKDGFNFFWGITSFLIIFYSISLAGNDWELAKSKDGINVYTKDVDGSNIKECLAIAYIDAPVEVVAEVLIDIPAYIYWMPKCKDSGYDHKDDDYNLVFYTITNLPWPVSDRLAVFEVKSAIDFDNGTYIHYFNPTNESKVTFKKKYVRMELLGHWDYKRVDPNRTFFSYQSKVNIRGHLPATIINLFFKNSLIDMMKGMQRMVRKEKYIKMAKDRFSAQKTSAYEQQEFN
ncbi:MAG: hypothetical protein SVZ03_17170 [Spirochaetota bacterium]|nr:hypothetical protein [Spirochaetota bacterium]